MTQTIPETPRTQAGDIAHVIAKAGLSSVPVVGSAAAELFTLLVQPPLERRRAAWMTAVGEKLLQLERAGVSLESLRDNERFVSLVMHASQIAMRTHSSLKLEALRSAISSAATGSEVHETLNHVHLNLVDELTSLHIRILTVLNSPPLPPQDETTTIPEILQAQIPELRGNQMLMHQLNRDLYNRGLLRTPLHPRDKLSRSDLSHPRTTKFGEGFLKFIEQDAET